MNNERYIVEYVVTDTKLNSTVHIFATEKEALEKCIAKNKVKDGQKWTNDCGVIVTVISCNESHVWVEVKVGSVTFESPVSYEELSTEFRKCD